MILALAVDDATERHS